MNNNSTHLKEKQILQKRVDRKIKVKKNKKSEHSARKKNTKKKTKKQKNKKKKSKERKKRKEKKDVLHTALLRNCKNLGKFEVYRTWSALKSSGNTIREPYFET